MKTNDFNQLITSKTLAENLEKQFGSRVNLNSYNREQLEDIRNKLRTRIFQQEGSAGINDLLTNETYQKDKAMLELLNTRIKEMLGEQMQKLRDKMDALNEGKKGVKVAKHPQGSKMAKKDYDGDGKVETGKDEVLGSRAKAAAKAGHPFKEATSKKCCCSTKGEDSCPVHGMKEGWDDMMNKVKSDHEKEKTSTTGKFDKKDTTTGTVYTRKSSTFDNGTEDKPKEKKVKEGAKPDFLDMDKDGNKKEPMKKAAAAKKHAKGCTCNECSGMYEGKDEGKPGKNFAKIAKDAGKRYGSKEAGERVAGAVRAKLSKQGKLEESNFKHNVRFVNESLQFLLSEDEEGKAKAITAAGDMVNDFTSWMQRVGQYQTKSMIELADAIKADFGPTEAEAFKAALAPALSATLEVLTQQREVISAAVATLAGGAAPEAPMGMEPEMPMDPSMDMSAPDEMNPAPAGDEFGAADAAAGGAETSGRAMRENKFSRRLAESHSIMSKLAK